MPDEFPSQHFVDTNILIGYSVAWDNQSHPVEQYTSSGSFHESVHWASEAVLDEAEDVVNKQRRLARQAAKIVFEQGNTGAGPNAEQDLINLVRSEFNDDSISGVLNLIEDRPHLFIGLTQTDSRHALIATINDLKDLFDKPSKFVDQLREGEEDFFSLNIFRSRPDSYADIYDSTFDDLDDLIENKADRDILFDSYHLLRSNGMSGLVFVTADHTDILSVNDEIEVCLDGVLIRSPVEID